MDIQNEEELEDYSVEIEILTECQHPNVVGLYESFLFNDKLWVSDARSHIIESVI